MFTCDPHSPSSDVESRWPLERSAVAIGIVVLCIRKFDRPLQQTETADAAFNLLNGEYRLHVAGHRYLGVLWETIGADRLDNDAHLAYPSGSAWLIRPQNGRAVFKSD